MLKPTVIAALWSSRPRISTLIEAGAPEDVVTFFRASRETWGGAWHHASPEVQFWVMLRQGFLDDWQLRAVAGKACELMAVEWNLSVDDVGRIGGLYDQPKEVAVNEAERALALLGNSAGICQMAFHCSMALDPHLGCVQCCMLLLLVRMAGSGPVERERVLRILIDEAKREAGR